METSGPLSQIHPVVSAWSHRGSSPNCGSSSSCSHYIVFLIFDTITLVVYFPLAHPSKRWLSIRPTKERNHLRSSCGSSSLDENRHRGFNCNGLGLDKGVVTKTPKHQVYAPRKCTRKLWRQASTIYTLLVWIFALTPSESVCDLLGTPPDDFYIVFCDRDGDAMIINQYTKRKLDLLEHVMKDFQSSRGGAFPMSYFPQNFLPRNLIHLTRNSNKRWRVC